jgi:hypothetical protein
METCVYKSISHEECINTCLASNNSLLCRIIFCSESSEHRDRRGKKLGNYNRLKGGLGGRDVDYSPSGWQRSGARASSS